MSVEFTARGSGYYRVYVDGIQVSRHIAEREAAERAVNEAEANPGAHVRYDHDYEVDVILQSAPSRGGGSSPPSGGGGGGEGLPVYTATHYADSSGSASWANAVNSGTPCSLATALANASAGDVVELAPGIYTGTSTSDRFTPAFNPANSGASGSPIIFYAENRAGLTYSAGVTTELRNGVTTADTGCPTIGADSRNYIIWDGILVNEVNSASTSDTGPAVFHSSTGSEFRSVVLRGTTTTRNDNHCGVRLEVVNGCKVTDCYIDGFELDIGSASQNCTGIMTYDARNCVVEYNDISANGIGIFWKGDHGGDGSPQETNITRYNKIYDNTIAGIRWGANTSTGFSDCYQNLMWGNDEHIRITDYGSGSAQNMRMVNNTLYNAVSTNPSAGALQHQYTSTALGCVFKNNAVRTVLTLHGSYTTSSLADISNSMDMDYNGYSDYSDIGDSEGSGTLDSASQSDWTTEGLDVNSIWGTNPLFANVGSNDYRLSDSSQSIGSGDSAYLDAGVDVLNLLGGGTSASINIGAFILSDQTDVIGRRT